MVIVLFPFPDLSLHALTVVVPVIVDASAASNHNAHPGISVGWKTRVKGCRDAKGAFDVYVGKRMFAIAWFAIETLPTTLVGLVAFEIRDAV